MQSHILIQKVASNHLPFLHLLGLRYLAVRSLLHFEIDDGVVIDADIGRARHYPCSNGSRILPPIHLFIHICRQETEFLGLVAHVGNRNVLAMVPWQRRPRPSSVHILLRGISPLTRTRVCISCKHPLLLLTPATLHRPRLLLLHTRPLQQQPRPQRRQLKTAIPSGATRLQLHVPIARRISSLDFLGLVVAH